MSLLAPSGELRACGPAVIRRGIALTRLWPLAILSLFFGACAARWPYLDVPISADEGGYGTAAYWWARGDTLYQNITITRPQGIFVIFRMLDLLNLNSDRGIHLAAMVWVGCCTLLLLAVAGRVWGRGIGFATAALFAVIMATPYLEGYSANAELWMLLPLLGSLWLTVRADDEALGSGRGNLLLFCGGVCGALALLLKPSAIVALLLSALWLLFRVRGERVAWRALLGAEIALAGGFVAGLAPALLHGLLTVPDIYLGAVVLYRVSRDSVIADQTGHQLTYFLTNSAFILARLPLLLLAPIGLLVRTPADTGPRWPNRGRTLLWLWLGTSFAGTALGGNWFLHYYQQLLPPFAVATIIGLSWLARRSPKPGVLALQGLAFGGLLGLAIAFVPTLIHPADPRTLPEWEPGVSAAAPIAAYLQDHTTSDEMVYVVYDHADIYYLAQRRPAARWLHFRELGWTPGALDEQFAILSNPATAPRYIVLTDDINRWGFDPTGRLQALVARDYTLDITIDGIPLYRRVH
jgi:hypothetical protein